MMKKNYLLLIIFALPFLCGAQITFQKTYGDLVADNGKAVVQCRDHGYCVIGETGPNLPDTQDIAVYRLDSIGNLVWTSRIFGSKDDFINDLQETSDGGFILVGTTFSSPLDAGSSDILAIRLDNTGYPMLSHVYGGQSADEGNSIMIVNNGGYVIAGTTTSFGTVTQSAVLLKIDDNLDQVWCNVSSITPINSFVKVQRTFDGGSIAVGGTNNSAGGSGTDDYICKFDLNGAITWGFRYGTAAADVPYDVKQTSDSGYAIAGMSSAFVIGTHGFPDQQIIKLTKTGTFSWSRNYGTAQYDRATGIVQNADGGFTLGGYTNVGDSSNPIYQYSITRTTAAGAYRYSRSFGDQINLSESTGIIRTNDDGFALVGQNFGFSDPNGDSYLVKTDSLGSSRCYESLTAMGSTNIPSLLNATNPVSAMVTMDDLGIALGYTQFINQFSTVCEDLPVGQIAEGKFLLYPNPASQNLTIQFEKNANDVNIEIGNMLGQVFECNLSRTSNEKISIDVSELPAGIYTVSAKTNTLSFSSKFVKE